MDSGEGLTSNPHLSQLTEPTTWNMTAVRESAVALGEIPDAIYYKQANSDYLVSPDGEQILISGVPFESVPFTHIFRVDGTQPPLKFTGICGVAWAPHGKSFLGILPKQVPYLGSLSPTSPTYQPMYYIQPVSAGADALFSMRSAQPAA